MFTAWLEIASPVVKVDGSIRFIPIGIYVGPLYGSSQWVTIEILTPWNLFDEDRSEDNSQHSE